jgi:glycosyltransferase involved in cell wall biosynthesis
MNAASLGPADVKVSVAMVTYNHEAFITQAIESVLMQQTDFDFELVIGEDCSTDGTRAIVHAYGEGHPDRIRPLLSERNQGAHANFVASLNACRGSYIALLEGDDYWTSPEKLQRQVEFLDSHSHYSICFHNATEYYEDRIRESWNYCPQGLKETLTLKDLLLGNFMPTSSVMFRKGLFEDFPDWYFHLRFGDWPLHVFNAQHGNIRYLNRVMGVHRNHPGGIWSARDRIQNIEEVISFYRYIGAYLNLKYQRVIDVALSKCYFDMAIIYLERGDYGNAGRCIHEYLRHRPINRHVSPLRLFRAVVDSISKMWRG